MVTGVPLVGPVTLARALVGDVAHLGAEALKPKVATVAHVAAGLGLIAADRAYTAYNHHVRVPVAVAGLLLTGGGVNPIDLDNVIKAAPDVSRRLAIRGLRWFEGFVAPKE